MKKHIGFFFITFLTFFNVSAQSETVTWSTNVEKHTDDEYTLIYKVAINDGWHLYSQSVPEDGPIATSFSFENEGVDFERIGKTVESEPHVEFDQVFGMEIPFFSEEAQFTQRIKLLNKEVKVIKAILEYQTCDDKACLFEPGMELMISLDGSTVVTEKKEIDEESKALTNQLKLELKDKDKYLKGESKGESNLLKIFILGFLGGLIALLTPCVFPMIPLTVSFFTKKNDKDKSGKSKAFLYGFFIVFIYLLLSIPFHLMDSLDPEILNNISTNVWLNVAFFVIFMFFAFSFFGYYEITLPSSWGNKMDTASGIGGAIGVFFMALTLAIVSFSCTGPILGSLLVGSLTADGGAIQLSAGMVGFGVALALPFTLFALFPSWLKSLPKSGGWLNTVKVVLGFIEVALAFKFLSNADLVEHWGLLKREVFIGIWIAVFVGMALYLFGKIKFPHDSPLQKLSKGRLVFGLITALFVGYLGYGLFGGDLKLLSGFPPPEFYSLQEKESDCPLNLNCYKDFDEGIAYAKEKNMPVILDFTGWACVNCRKMEENVWSDTQVYEELQKYVLISLYVDDKRELPTGEQFDFEKANGQVKKIETIGAKWATFQTVNFEAASQPFYVLMTPDYRLLNYPEKYTDKATYLQWLKDGLQNFEGNQTPQQNIFTIPTTN
jgi:thiol:disulfide interchange protein DsbD